MSREVFTRRDVAQALSGWVPVRINSAGSVNITREYNIEGYPTFIALSADGAELRRSLGGMTAEEFITFLHSVRAATQPATRTQP
jgi:hypothetical protein